MLANQLQVTAAVNPFKTATVNMTIDAGLSIAQIMAQIQPDAILRRYANVYINDQYVRPEEWPTTYPGAKSLVAIRVVPHGGGGDKNPFAVILTIALMVTAPYLGAQFGALFGSQVATAVGTAVVGMVGALAISAIAPPPSQKMGALSGGKDSPTLSLAGSRNQAGLYRPIPVVLGRHLVTPYYGAPPYTELVGQDQYLRMLFVIGYGPLALSDFKIGETDLYEYEDVEIEVRQGWSDDPPLTLYPNTVTESSVGITLTNAAGWVEQTTIPDIDEFAVDVLFPMGLVEYNSSGTKLETTVQIDLEYKHIDEPTTWTAFNPVLEKDATALTAARPPGMSASREGETHPLVRTDLVYINKLTGRYGIRESKIFMGLTLGELVAPDNSYPIATYTLTGTSKTLTDITDLRPAELKAFGAGAFLPTDGGDLTLNIAAGSFTTPSLTITAKTTSAVRHGVTVLLPAKGQYDVRMRRSTADSTDDKLFNDSTWAALRNIENTDPIVKSGLCKVALRIKATDLLQRIVDQFNCVADSIMSDFNGTDWVEQITNNPASMYRSVFQGPAMKAPLAETRMHLTELEEWHTECVTKGYAYNAVIDYQTTPFELAKDIAAVGRAAYAMQDGLYSVVRDSPDIIDRGCKQWITPRNSWDVNGEKSFDEVHALKLRFVNADLGWRQDQVIVYADGFDAASASRIDEMTLHGVTDYDQAWQQGRYYLAVSKLRAEMHSRMVDAEHLVCTRGDMIRVVDDVAMHGICSGRLKTIYYHPDTGTAIACDVDELCPMDAEKTYGLRVRYNTGGDIYRAVETVGGDNSILVFTTAIAIADAPQAGDLFMFGESERESSEKIIHHIERHQDLTARIYYVDAAPEVYTADTGTIPAYDPGITVPADQTQFKPAAPSILAVRSDETAVVRGADGTFTAGLQISIAANPGAAQTANFECHYRQTDSNAPWLATPMAPAASGSINITDLLAGDEYVIRLRSVSPYGAVSEWVTATETVAGDTAAVVAPSGLAATAAVGQIELSWTINAAPNTLLGTEIHVSATNDRATATLLNTPTGNSFNHVVAGGATRYYWQRNVDLPGDVSEWHPESATAGVSATALLQEWSDLADTAGTKPADNADVTETAIANKISVTSGGLRVTNSATGDFTDISADDLQFYTGGVLSKSIRRIEHGAATTGIVEPFANEFSSPPSVIFYPKGLPIYSAANYLSDQRLEISADNITTTSFLPNVSQAIGDSAGAEFAQNLTIPVSTATTYDTHDDVAGDNVAKVVSTIEGAGDTSVWYSKWDGSAWGSNTLAGSTEATQQTVDAFGGSKSNDWQAATLIINPADDAVAPTIVGITSVDSGGGTGTLTAPTNAIGDLLIFIAAAGDNEIDTTLLGGTGWTQTSLTAHGPQTIIAYKPVTSVVASVSFDNDVPFGGGDEDVQIMLISVRGVALDDIFAATDYDYGGTGMPNPPAVIATKSNQLLAIIGTLDDSVTDATAPAGFGGLAVQYRNPAYGDRSTILFATAISSLLVDVATPVLTAGRYRLTYQNDDNAVTLKSVTLDTGAYSTDITGEGYYLAIEGGV